MAEHIDSLARYVWILKHQAGWYVRDLYGNGRGFYYSPIQKGAMRFSTREEAQKVAAKRNASMRHVIGRVGKVRVVRLKLKEKT